jgi:hypothetical protein
MMEAVRTSESSVYSETTLRYIPEGSNLNTRRRENLISHKFSVITPRVTIVLTQRRIILVRLVSYAFGLSA